MTSALSLHRAIAVPQEKVELFVPPFFVVLERELVWIRKVLPHPIVHCISVSFVHWVSSVDRPLTARGTILSKTEEDNGVVNARRMRGTWEDRARMGEAFGEEF